MVNRRWVQNGIPNFAFVLNRESLQAQGLVVWWPMLASHGANMLHDLVNSNNGVFNGVPIWKSDSQFGFVLDLDGTDDFVQNNDSFLSQITLLSPWTMAHWIIYDSLVGFSLGMSLAYRGGDDYASIGTSGSSTKIASAAKTPGTGATVSTGVWYHQTLVWDGTDLYSYLNGVFDYSVTPTSAIIWADLDTLVQGATIISGGSNAEVDGRVVDGRLYNRQLSAIEIYQLYAPQTRWELYQPVIYRSLPFVSAGLTLLKLENETVNVGDTDGLRFRILIRLLTDITNISETILSIRTLIRVLI
ncbi:LamG domain-containing protein, partial [Candidatus Pacearchaeota archaeon]|nr:LamG domain-containing protein [Candidatus Pacearchaeota archaeon]